MTAVVVTKDDNNRSIQVCCNQELIVRLPENRSTGFLWAVENPDQTALKLQSDAFTPPAGGRIGAGGYRTLTYFALKPVEVKLNLKLRRPWEQKSTADSFSISVRIVGPCS